MSESTTKSAKTTSKSTGPESKSTKSESKPTKSESKSASPEGTSKSGDATAAKSDGKPGEKSTKGRAAADHSPSYFSSVSSPEYRAGWDSVFSSGRGAKKATAKPRRAKPGNGLPVTIVLEHTDLDDDIRAAIEDAFRRKARKKRVKFDQFMKKAHVTWRLECHFSD